MGGGGGSGSAKRRKTRMWRKTVRDRRIPPEITEAILLNLPVKSLLRFSSVSKSWNSIIFEPCFIKKYRGSENLVRCKYLGTPSFDLFPSVLSDNHATTTTTPLKWPVEGKPYVLAFCDELWCVYVKPSLFLWNPSMRTYRKLCDPPSRISSGFLDGLGYDAVGDDYKMLRIGLAKAVLGEVELYSLRSDSWKKIQHFPQTSFSCSYYNINGLLVNGTFHWSVVNTGINPHSQIIISFNLATEQYGEMAMPEHSPQGLSDSEGLADRIVTLTVSSGKLCMCAYYYPMKRLVKWTMENYGVAESWSITFDISYDHEPFRGVPLSILRHVKSYDDSRILIKALGVKNGALNGSLCNYILHIESLVSPNLW